MTELKTVAKEKYDVIFFIASFHHLSTIEQREQCLKKIKSMLKKDGIICMTNWNLFQKKYRKRIVKSFFKSLISKLKWNDTIIPFTKK